jgi:membrane protein implicated in regulation of membrane protease activity
MSVPVSRYREPSFVLLMIGIAASAFGLAWLLAGRHTAAAAVITAVGLVLAVATRVHRSRTGRWP